MKDWKIVGSHPVMRAIVAAVERLAKREAPVLVTGEKGTGKGLIARELHAMSTRATRPLVRVDCDDGQYERLERELCGADRPDAPASAWQRVAGGVLLLDEITALPIELQRRLAERLRRTTGQGSAWVVATAQHDVADGLRSGRLSAELVQSLDPVEIPLPALRQRRADIPVLVEHFLAAYAGRHTLGACRIETDALVHLWQYDWPGNVRELESVVERIVVLCRAGIVRLDDLPPHISGCAAAKSRGTNSHSTTAKPFNGVPILRTSL